MEQIKFKVRGSTGSIYDVVFTRRSETNLSATCTCAGGEYGFSCKHRIGLLAGETKSITSKNKDDIIALKAWLIGTDIEAAIATLRAIEADAELIKIQLSDAKKALAKSMAD